MITTDMKKPEVSTFQDLDDRNFTLYFLNIYPEEPGNLEFTINLIRAANM
jgi:hypothetical protein